VRWRDFVSGRLFTYGFSGKVQVLNGPLKNNHHGQRNLDRAMRRYLAAIKALAVVQRCALPPIQVNIAEQQVVANR